VISNDIFFSYIYIQLHLFSVFLPNCLFECLSLFYLKNYKMKVTAEKNEKVANMIFGSIYPHYLSRLEKNGRTKKELNQVIEWFTGYNEEMLQTLIDEKVTFSTFFDKAKIHPNEYMIKGVVCGYRIEEIEDEFVLYKQCRQMEKLIDELAKGRKMEKIIRKEKK